MKMRQHRKRQARASRLWLGGKSMTFRSVDELMAFLEGKWHGAR